MLQLVETRKALAGDYLRLAGMSGERPSAIEAPGMITSPVGYTEFRIGIHEGSDIDPLAPLGVALGEDYVREIDQELALRVNILVDRSPRQEEPETAARKTKAALSIAGLLKEALPYPDDWALMAGVYQKNSSAKVEKNWDEHFYINDRQQFADLSYELSRDGQPTVLVSDFRDMKFPFEKMTNAIGVIVKDITELEVSPNDAPALGIEGDFEVHTADPKQMETYNSWLQAEHEKLIHNLGHAGMSTVSIITARGLTEGYDLSEADRGLAVAFREVAQKA